jgi:hypothetical protein
MNNHDAIKVWLIFALGAGWGSAITAFLVMIEVTK